VSNPGGTHIHPKEPICTDSIDGNGVGAKVSDMVAHSRRLDQIHRSDRIVQSLANSSEEIKSVRPIESYFDEFHF
jgi:hypothetical protein